MARWLARTLLAGSVAVLGLPDAAPAAEDASRVLVVVNADSASSIELGEYYARARRVPQEQVLRLALRGPRGSAPVSTGIADAPAATVGPPAAGPGASRGAGPGPVGAPLPSDEITRGEYERRIEGPIAQWIHRAGAQDRILFIVVAKGIPLRITGSTGRSGTLASVDSELALLYRKMTGRLVPLGGPVENPYFLADAPIESARPFSHRDHDIYLVTRLDGFTLADAKALVDRAAAARADGRILLDQRATPPGPANAWLDEAAARLTRMGLGDRVVLEPTSRVLLDETEVLAYAGWGSSDPAVKTRRFGFGFVPGALAALFVSTDARTFTEPPAEWTVGAWQDRRGHYAGSPESLAGDLVREGVSGLAAHVAEPFLDGSVRPQVLFPAYLSGFTLAEAFYLAMPYAGWRGIVLGDPLCRAVPRPSLAEAEAATDAAPDPLTGTGPFFARRWLEAAQAQAPRGSRFRLDALRLVLKAQSSLARADEAGSRAALEQATALEPGIISAQVTLASLYEARGDDAGAEARYRAVLRQSPNHVVALNNLAYLLGARQRRLEEALTLARRAHALAPGNPSVADTLGWLFFLAGDTAQAARYVGEALREGGHLADVRVHAAAVALAAGQLDAAAAQLEAALALDDRLADRADVRELRARLDALRR